MTSTDFNLKNEPLDFTDEDSGKKYENYFATCVSTTQFPMTVYDRKGTKSMTATKYNIEDGVKEPCRENECELIK